MEQVLSSSPIADAVMGIYAGLRDYQIAAIEAIRAAIAAGKRRICVVAPTGSGKTKIGAFIMRQTASKLKRAAFVCDRINLIDQTSRVFDDEGIAHGVVQGDHPRISPWERVQVCSVQTVARRKWPSAEVILIDECHTISQTVIKRMADDDGSTIFIGLTATPFTKGLAKMYDCLINVATTNDLIRRGFLSPFRIYAAREPDMRGVPVVGGEFDVAETSRRASAVVGDCVAEYLRLGQDRKFICSAVDTAHVQELERQFMAAGIITRAYTYREGDVERAEVVEEFRRPDSSIRGLITVTAASKGFDVPDVGVVIMARPLRASLSEYIQLFGRGLRIYPGKSDCIVLDHSGNSERFWDHWTTFFDEGALGFVGGRQNVNASRSEKAEAKPVKCPACKCLHHPMPYCPTCGHVYPPRRAVLHAPGSLVELVTSFDRKTVVDTLYPQIVGEALRRNKGDKAESWSRSKFFAITGYAPTVPFASVVPVEPCADVRNKILAMDIAWAKKTGYRKGRK
jgi:superfamily II DNA or RNA helicase